MTKMDLIRNLAEDFNFGELHIAPVEAVKTVPCTLHPDSDADSGYLQSSCHHCVLGGRR